MQSWLTLFYFHFSGIVANKLSAGLVITGQPSACSSAVNQSSADPIIAGEIYAGSITTSQPFGSPTTADQSAGSITSVQSAIIAGSISAHSIIVTQMPPANITVGSNVKADVLPISCNDNHTNVSAENNTVTGTKTLQSKEGMKLRAKSQIKLIKYNFNDIIIC